VAVPIHWGTLEPILATKRLADGSSSAAEEFAQRAATLAPGVEVVVLPPGGTVEL